VKDEKPHMTTFQKELGKNIGNFFTHVSNNFIEKLLEKKPSNETDLFLFTVLIKLNNGLASSLFLLAPCRDSLCIIFRTLISDSITTIYLIDKSEDDVEFEKNIQSLNTDHLSFTINNIKNYGYSIYNFSQKKIDEEINYIKEEYKSYFNTDGSFKYKPLKIKIADAVKFLVEVNNEYKNLYGLAFELYELFSKYEHLGVFSSELLLKRQYSPERELDLLQETLDSIKIILFGISNILHASNYINLEDEEKFFVLFNEIFQMQNELNKLKQN
jgi:hypothetical protein